jgi:hypothetical protein
LQNRSREEGPQCCLPAGVQEAMAEDACAENNQHLFDYHIPVADKPDF